jgi:hypothetical protein
MLSASSATLPCITIPQTSIKPKPTTNKPLLWPTNSACVPSKAHCHHGLGTFYSQTGQSEQARAELSTAIELYREMEMTFWLPETEAALAQQVDTPPHHGCQEEE